jgi:hypothetical protein
MYRLDHHTRAQPSIAAQTTLGEPGSGVGPTRGDAAAAVPIVSAAEGLALLTEVDSRRIAGNAGTVTLYLTADCAAARYLVDVESAAGEPVARIATATPAEALEAYRHPFASPDVPDIFRSATS